MSNDDSDKDTFKILLATDVHLGYMEKDGIRGNDSLVTFEEVLELAKEHEVDFVLLGGDLFHENKPTRNCMHGCISLLRKYSFNNKPVEFEVISDQSTNFGHTPFPTVNYEDPNLNVGIPVFSISGNHDDPAGTNNLCALDLLHSAGLVNYFGRTKDLENIQVSPLLLKKGSTRLALYGLGAIRDERLHRLFLHKQVSMLRPRQSGDDWFSLMVVHQNHVRHGAKSYLPEQFLDPFLDLVVWGHEHECRIDPVRNEAQGFFVTQPGSTIATSLSAGEAVQKHAALLYVKDKKFKMDKLPLKTVRQFYTEDILLCETNIDSDQPDAAKLAQAYCEERVNSLLDRAEMERSGNPRQPDKPLVRLRVDTTGGYETFSAIRFGQKFLERVANPRDIVKFNQRRAAQLDDAKDAKPGEIKEFKTEKHELLDSGRVEDMVRQWFSTADHALQLQVLTERGMGEAVKEFVDKEERDAIHELVKYQLDKTQKHLRQRNVPDENIDREVEMFREQRRRRREVEDEEVAEAVRRSKQNSQQRESQNNELATNTISDEDAAPKTNGRTRVSRGSTRARGGRARGRGTRGRGRGAVSVIDMMTQSQKRKANRSDSDDVVSVNDSDEFDVTSSPSAKRKRGASTRARRAAASTTAVRSSQRSSQRRGVVFDSEDDDDDAPTINFPKKRRR